MYAILRLTLVLALMSLWNAALTPSWAEGDPAALAAALKDTTATLQGGLKASEREGIPISCQIRDRGRKSATFGLHDEGQ
jgi:hypothetical protein